MSELENQTDEAITEENFNEEVEQEVEETEASELATDTEAEPKQNTEESRNVNQEKINAAINRKHREAMEWKEKYEALQQQQGRMQSNLPPEIPAMPDPFDDDYQEKVRARDEAIQKRASYDAEQNLRQQIEQQQSKQALQAQIQRVKEQTEKYAKSAVEYGVTPEQLQQYGMQAGQYLSQDIAMSILGDAEGVLLTKYLAQNPQDAIDLSGMNPYQAALHMERVIRPAAQKLKPKATGAPTPPKKVDTSGASIEIESPLLKGASFT